MTCDINEKIILDIFKGLAEIFQNSNSVKNIFNFCNGNINNVYFRFFLQLNARNEGKHWSIPSPNKDYR